MLDPSCKRCAWQLNSGDEHDGYSELRESGSRSKSQKSEPDEANRTERVKSEMPSIKPKAIRFTREMSLVID